MGMGNGAVGTDPVSVKPGSGDQHGPVSATRLQDGSIELKGTKAGTPDEIIQTYLDQNPALRGQLRAYLTAHKQELGIDEDTFKKLTTPGKESDTMLGKLMWPCFVSMQIVTKDQLQSGKLPDPLVLPDPTAKGLDETLGKAFGSILTAWAKSKPKDAPVDRDRVGDVPPQKPGDAPGAPKPADAMAKPDGLASAAVTSALTPGIDAIKAAKPEDARAAFQKAMAAATSPDERQQIFTRALALAKREGFDKTQTAAMREMLCKDPPPPITEKELLRDFDHAASLVNLGRVAQTQRTADHWQKEALSGIPKAVQEKYGITKEALDEWRKTGVMPDFVSKMAEAYSASDQKLYAYVSLLTAYGLAVNAERLATGEISAKAAASLDQIDKAISKTINQKWEQFNEGYTRTVCAAASKAYGDFQSAHAEWKRLSSAQPKDDAAIAAAKKRQDDLMASWQAKQTVADKAAAAMKKVRDTQLEAAGGDKAPEAVKDRAASATLRVARGVGQGAAIDAAYDETPGVDPSNPTGTRAEAKGTFPPGATTALGLVNDAEKQQPNWRTKPDLIADREGALEPVRTALRPYVDGAEKRAKAQKTIPDAPLAPNFLDAPLDPDIVLLKQWGQATAKLDGTYKADIALTQSRRPQTPADKAHLRDVGRRARDLEVEVRAAADDAQDGVTDGAKQKADNDRWAKFGRDETKAQLDDADRRLNDLEAKIFNAKRDGKPVDALTTDRDRLRKERRELQQRFDEGEARYKQGGRPTPLDDFRARRAGALADAYGIPEQPPGAYDQLSSDAASDAIRSHDVVRATYDMNKPDDAIEFGKENADFIRTKSGWATRELDRQKKLTAMFRVQDETRLSSYQKDKTELASVRRRLAELPPKGKGDVSEEADRARLEKKKTELEGSLRDTELEFGTTYPSMQDVQNRDIARQNARLYRPMSKIDGLRGERDLNAADIQRGLDDLPTPKTEAEKKHQDELRRTAVDGFIAAAETFTETGPAAAARHLRAAKDATKGMTPEARLGANAHIAARSLALLQQYVLHPHASAEKDTASLALAVQEAMELPGVPQATIDAWKAFRRQSDPEVLFAVHDMELDAGLAFLEAQVELDIDAMYDMAVENGGLFVGTIARAARLAKDGHIEEAKQLLRQAVARAKQEGQKAKTEYKALNDSQQEQYRAVLRTNDPNATEEQNRLAKIDALTELFKKAGVAPDEAERRATRAVTVAAATHTQIRAHTGGADYDMGRSARKTKADLDDPNGTLIAKGGQEAEAMAARWRRRKESDEAYWNDPMTRVGVALVDEAFLFVATAGASSAFSALRATKTAMTIARWANAGREAFAATRWGARIIEGGRAVASLGSKFRTGLAAADAAATGVHPLLGVGFRWARSIAHMKAIEYTQKYAGEAAGAIFGKDSWVKWAVDSGGRFYVYRMGGPVKGMTAVENGAWSVGQTFLTEMVLRDIYKGRPAKDFEHAQEALGWVFVAVQTGIGLKHIRAEAKQSAAIESAGLAHDLHTAGVELTPAKQKELNATVTAYYEALQHNHGKVTPEAHEAFVRKVYEVTGAESPQAKAAVETFLQPHHMNAAAQSAGLDKVDFSKSPPPSAQELLQQRAVMEKRLIESGAAQDQAAAAKLVDGHIAAQMLDGAMKWANLGDIDLLDGKTKPFEVSERAQKAADRLLEAGVVKTRAEAMMLVKAQLEQGLQTRLDAAAAVPPGVTDEQRKQAYAASLELSRASAAYSLSEGAASAVPAEHQKSVAAIARDEMAKTFRAEGSDAPPLKERIKQRVTEELRAKGVENPEVVAEQVAQRAIVDASRFVSVAADGSGLDGRPGTPEARAAQERALVQMGAEPTQARDVATKQYITDVAQTYAEKAGPHKEAVQGAVERSLTAIEANPPVTMEKLAKLEADVAKDLAEHQVPADDATAFAKEIAHDEQQRYAYDLAARAASLGPHEPATAEKLSAFLTQYEANLKALKLPEAEVASRMKDAQAHFLLHTAAPELAKHKDLAGQRTALAETAKKLALGEEATTAIVDDYMFAEAAREAVRQLAAEHQGKGTQPTEAQVRERIEKLLVESYPEAERAGQTAKTKALVAAKLAEHQRAAAPPSETPRATGANDTANAPGAQPPVGQSTDAQVAARAAPTAAEIRGWLPHEASATRLGEAFARAKASNDVATLRVLHGIVELARTNPEAARTAQHLLLGPDGGMFRAKLAALVQRGDAAYTASVVHLLGDIYGAYKGTQKATEQRRLKLALDHLTQEPAPKNFEAVREAFARADRVAATDPAHAAQLRADVLGMVAARHEELLAQQAAGRTDDAAARGSNFRFEEDHLPPDRNWPTHTITVRIDGVERLLPVMVLDGNATIFLPDGRTEVRRASSLELRPIERGADLVASESHVGAQWKQGYVVGKSGGRDLVWNVTERRFEMVQSGEFRPTAHGKQAVGLIGSEVHTKAEHIVAHFDDFAAKLPAAEQALLLSDMFARGPTTREAYDRMSHAEKKMTRETYLKARYEEMLQSARSPEEQAILMKVFVERGSFADVERVQTMLKAYFGSEAPSPEALQRLTTGDGIRQLFQATCGPTDFQLVGVAANPLEALRLVSLGREGLIEEQAAMMREINSGLDPRTAADVAFVPGMGDRAVQHAPAYDPAAVSSNPQQWGSVPSQMQYWMNARFGARQGTSYEQMPMTRDAQGFPRPGDISAAEQRIWSQFSGPADKVPSEGIVVGVSWVTGSGAGERTGSGHWIQITRAYERNGERFYVVRDPWTGKTSELKSSQLFNARGGDVLGGRGVVTSVIVREPAEVTRGRDALGRNNNNAGEAFAQAYRDARALEADPNPARRTEGQARRATLERIARETDQHAAQEALLAFQRFPAGDPRSAAIGRILDAPLEPARRTQALAALRQTQEAAAARPGRVPPDFHAKVIDAMIAGHLTPEQVVKAAQMLAWDGMPANQRTWFTEQWSRCTTAADFTRVVTETSRLFDQARMAATQPQPAVVAPTVTPPTNVVPPGESTRLQPIDESGARTLAARFPQFETIAKATPNAENPAGMRKTVLEAQPGDSSLSKTYATPEHGVGAKVFIGEQVVIDRIPPGQPYSLASHGFNSCAACVVKATRADGSTVIVFSHITGQNSQKTQLEHIQDALRAARASPPPDPNLKLEVFVSMDPAAGVGASLPRNLEGTSSAGEPVRFAGNMPVNVELVPGTTDRYRVRDASGLAAELGPNVDLHVDLARVGTDGKPIERNVFVTESGVVVTSGSEVRGTTWGRSEGYGNKPVSAESALTVANAANRGGGVTIERGAQVKAGIDAAYEHGVQLPEETFGEHGLEADPRHASFVAQQAARLKAQNPKPIDGQIVDMRPEDAQGSKDAVVRVVGPEGEVFVKPADANRPGAAEHEVAAYDVSDMLGTGLVPRTEMRAFEGDPASAQEGVKPPYKQGTEESEKTLLTDPRYKDALSDLRVFDYVIGNPDRQPANLFHYVDESGVGHIRAIDNASAFDGVIPSAKDAFPISGGRLPEKYTDKTIAAIERMTPETIRKRFEGKLSPAEIDAMIVRVETVRADILAKHGSNAFAEAKTRLAAKPEPAFGGPPPTPAHDGIVPDVPAPVMIRLGQILPEQPGWREKAAAAQAPGQSPQVKLPARLATELGNIPGTRIVKYEVTKTDAHGQSLNEIDVQTQYAIFEVNVGDGTGKPEQIRTKRLPGTSGNPYGLPVIVLSTKINKDRAVELAKMGVYVARTLEEAVAIHERLKAQAQSLASGRGVVADERLLPQLTSVDPPPAERQTFKDTIFSKLDPKEFAATQGAKTTLSPFAQAEAIWRRVRLAGPEYEAKLGTLLTIPDPTVRAQAFRLLEKAITYGELRQTLDFVIEKFAPKTEAPAASLEAYGGPPPSDHSATGVPDDVKAKVSTDSATRVRQRPQAERAEFTEQAAQVDKYFLDRYASAPPKEQRWLLEARKAVLDNAMGMPPWRRQQIIEVGLKLAETLQGQDVSLLHGTLRLYGKLQAENPALVKAMDAYLALPLEARVAGGEGLRLAALADRSGTTKLADRFLALPQAQRTAVAQGLQAIFVANMQVEATHNWLAPERSGSVYTAEEIAREQATGQARLEIEQHLTDMLFQQAQAGAVGLPFTAPIELRNGMTAIAAANSLSGDHPAAKKLLLGPPPKTPAELDAIFRLLNQQSTVGKPYDLGVVQRYLEQAKAKGLLKPGATPTAEATRLDQLRAFVESPALTFDIKPPLAKDAAKYVVDRAGKPVLDPKTKQPIEIDSPAGHAALREMLRREMEATELKGRTFPPETEQGIVDFFGQRVSRRALETILRPNVPGYTCEITRVSAGEHDFAVEGVIRDANGRAVGIIARSAFKEGDGHMVWKNDSLHLDQSQHAAGLAKGLYAQTEAFLSLVAPDMGTEIRLRANLTVGKYAWARMGYDFRDAAARDGVAADFHSLTRSMLADYPASVRARVDAAIDLCKTPQDFASLRFFDDKGKEILITVPNSGEAKIENSPVGKAFMLSLPSGGWDASRFPNRARAEAEARAKPGVKSADTAEIDAGW